MTITEVRLVDGEREMLLLPRQSQGVYLGSITAPFPAVREVSEPRSDDDGERDTTQLFGARSCAVELMVTSSPRAVEDELIRFLHPRTRPYLHVTDTEWAQERRLMLRVDQLDAPLTADLPPDVRKMQAQWKCPDGIWEAATATQVPDINADLVSNDGIGFPIAFPATFAATTATGAAQVSNAGGVPSHFTARLYGPCAGPALINETTGEQITFTPALVLGPGEYVEISTRDRSAFLLSNPAISRLGHLDFAQTSWWRIEPGTQSIRYAPETGSAGAVAVIEYRPTWL